MDDFIDLSGGDGSQKFTYLPPLDKSDQIPTGKNIFSIDLNDLQRYSACEKKLIYILNYLMDGYRITYEYIQNIKKYKFEIINNNEERYSCIIDCDLNYKNASDYRLFFTLINSINRFTNRNTVFGINNLYEYDENIFIEFNSKEETKKLQDVLDIIVKECGVLNIYEVLVLLGNETLFIHNCRGWTDLSDMYMMVKGKKYVLVLPKIKHLQTEEYIKTKRPIKSCPRTSFSFIPIEW